MEKDVPFVIDHMSRTHREESLYIRRHIREQLNDRGSTPVIRRCTQSLGDPQRPVAGLRQSPATGSVELIEKTYENRQLIEAAGCC